MHPMPGWLHPTLHVKTVSQGSFPFCEHVDEMFPWSSEYFSCNNDWSVDWIWLISCCRSWRSGRAQAVGGDGGARGSSTRNETLRIIMWTRETLASLRSWIRLLSIHVVKIFKKVEDDSEGERARRAALLDWDGDYSHFQRDEVTCPSSKAPLESGPDSRPRRKPRSPLQIRSTFESVGDSPRFLSFSFYRGLIFFDVFFRLIIQPAWITLSSTTTTSLTMRAHIQGFKMMNVILIC